MNGKRSAVEKEYEKADLRRVASSAVSTSAVGDFGQRYEPGPGERAGCVVDMIEGRLADCRRPTFCGLCGPKATPRAVDRRVASMCAAVVADASGPGDSAPSGNCALSFGRCGDVDTDQLGLRANLLSAPSIPLRAVTGPGESSCGSEAGGLRCIVNLGPSEPNVLNSSLPIGYRHGPGWASTVSGRSGCALPSRSPATRSFISRLACRNDASSLRVSARRASSCCCCSKRSRRRCSSIARRRRIRSCAISCFSRRCSASSPRTTSCATFARS
mmetsp:Transcript_26547/g.58175  ORF Transcript_26547/g.58175 Transcript_26547/m.58175 type:complete len:273 (-) Transcript_26547:98-916(-)